MAPIDIKAGQNMIKSQQALQNIYMKQTKNKQNKEKGAEEKKFELEDKMEKILGRRQMAGKIRDLQINDRNKRIQSALAKKERGPSDDGINSQSARSGQGVWKSLVFKDQ